MARSWFGGTHLDVVVRPYRFGSRSLADLVASSKVAFWDAETGGAQVVDLLDSAGSPVNSVTSDTDGYLPRFQGPDGVLTLWADAGFGRRFLMITTDGAIDISEDLSTRIPTAEKGAIDGVATLDGSGKLPDAQLPDSALTEAEATVEYLARGELFALVTDPDYGAVGDGVADDTAAIQAAIDSGRPVWLPPGTYRTTATLTFTAQFRTMLGPGPSAKIKYEGSGWAIECNVGGSAYINNARIGGFELQGTSAAAGGVLVESCQQSDFSIERFTGFTGIGAWAMRFTTEDQVSGGRAAAHNRIWGGHIISCYNGIQFTKHPNDTDTDGANHCRVYGTRISGIGADLADQGNPTAYGIDIDFGENTNLYGVDASTNTDNTVGIRIGDSVCGVFGCRTDGTQGVNALDSDGINIGASGSDFLILNPTGNGMFAAQYITYDDPTTPGIVLRHGRTVWNGNVTRTLAATGSDFWVGRTWHNVGGSTVAATEVASLASGDLEGEVRRSASGSATTRPLPLVAVENVASGAVGVFAEPGSVVNVQCDTGAVAIGDTIVASTNTHGHAMADNTVTDPRFIVGIARSSKGSGSAGNVKVYIR